MGINDITTSDSAARAGLRETSTLIGSDKVEGTAVRRPNGDKIGEIERVMIDKRSGRVAYAVMSFGGFLGMGEEYYPVPWDRLTYNTDLDAYELDIDDRTLQGAPAYSADFGRGDEQRMYDYYQATPYWTF